MFQIAFKIIRITLTFTELSNQSIIVLHYFALFMFLEDTYTCSNQTVTFISSKD